MKCEYFLERLGFSPLHLPHLCTSSPTNTDSEKCVLPPKQMLLYFEFCIREIFLQIIKKPFPDKPNI